MKIEKTYTRMNGNKPAVLTLHPPTCKVSSKEQYQWLEEYIDQLVDFAAEIREAEPGWRTSK